MAYKLTDRRGDVLHEGGIIECLQVMQMRRDVIYEKFGIVDMDFDNFGMRIVPVAAAGIVPDRAGSLDRAAPVIPPS